MLNTKFGTTWLSLHYHQNYSVATHGNVDWLITKLICDTEGLKESFEKPLDGCYSMDTQGEPHT